MKFRQHYLIYFIVKIILLHHAIIFCGKKKQNSQESLYNYFLMAIRAGDLEGVKAFIKQGIDLNFLYGKFAEQKTPINDALDQASFSLERNLPDFKIRLEIIELMLRNDAQINIDIFRFGDLHYVALEKVLLPFAPRTELISMLLRYGAEIDDKAFLMANIRNNVKEVRKILVCHQRLRQKASESFTDEASQEKAKELLRIALMDDNPCVLQLLIKSGLKITKKDLEAAKILGSKAAGRVLIKHFAIKHLCCQIRQALKDKLIVELIDYILYLAIDEKSSELAISYK